MQHKYLYLGCTSNKQHLYIYRKNWKLHSASRSVHVKIRVHPSWKTTNECKMAEWGDGLLTRCELKFIGSYYMRVDSKPYLMLPT